jgi:hypothetical protein
MHYTQHTVLIRSTISKPIKQLTTSYCPTLPLPRSSFPIPQGYINRSPHTRKRSKKLNKQNKYFFVDFLITQTRRLDTANIRYQKSTLI